MRQGPGGVRHDLLSEHGPRYQRLHPPRCGQDRQALPVGPSQERQQDCLTGAVKDFILTHADPERGLAVCRALPGEQKAGCYGTVGEMLVSLYPETRPRREACARSEPAFVDTCKGTAAVP